MATQTLNYTAVQLEYLMTHGFGIPTTYNAGSTYQIKDIVVYNYVGYCVLQEVTGVTPTNDGVYYIEIVVGVQGISFKVLGLYATLGALQTAHPTGSAGDAYAVGTDSSNVVYIWDVDTTAWVSIGSLQGPAGTGDMNASTYDTTSKAEDIFAYADNAASISALTAETAIVDGDYFPYQDTSASAKRKTLWSNIKSVLKTYFDTVYSSLAPSVVDQSASYTLALTDAGTVQKCSSASTITVTVPLNSSVAFPINTEIVLVRYGAGAVTLSPTGGVTLNSSGSKKSINAQYEAVTLKKIGTDEWLLIGALTT